MTNWTRRFEFASLILTTWSFPLFFIIMGFIWFFYVLPAVSSPFLNYSMIFIFLFLGISWNTRFGAGGMIFMTAFIHYVKGTETDFDRFRAKESFVGLLFWPFVLLFILSIIIRIYYVK